MTLAVPIFSAGISNRFLSRTTRSATGPFFGAQAAKDPMPARTIGPRNLNRVDLISSLLVMSVSIGPCIAEPEGRVKKRPLFFGGPCVIIILRSLSRIWTVLKES